MKFLALSALLALWVADAFSEVITFDDVPGAHLNAVGRMPPDEYHEFVFSWPRSWINTGPGSVEWPYGTRSGEFSLINGIVSSPSSVGRHFGESFTFDGLWAKAFPRPEGFAEEEVRRA